LLALAIDTEIGHFCIQFITIPLHSRYSRTFEFYCSSSIVGKDDWPDDLLPDRPKMVATKLFFLCAAFLWGE
jgi:hypothetical protein